VADVEKSTVGTFVNVELTTNTLFTQPLQLYQREIVCGVLCLTFTLFAP